MHSEVIVFRYAPASYPWELELWQFYNCAIYIFPNRQKRHYYHAYDTKSQQKMIIQLFPFRLFWFISLHTYIFYAFSNEIYSKSMSKPALKDFTFDEPLKP